MKPPEQGPASHPCKPGTAHPTDLPPCFPFPLLSPNPRTQRQPHAFPVSFPNQPAPGGGGLHFPLRALSGARSRAEPSRAVPALPPRGAQLPPAWLGSARSSGEGPGRPGSLARPLWARARSRKAAEGRLRGTRREREGTGKERGGGCRPPAAPPRGPIGRRRPCPRRAFVLVPVPLLPRPEAGMRQAGLPAAPRRAQRVGVLLVGVRGPAPEVCASGCLQPLPP